ncbi:MAG: S8 family serine peptidase [Propionibacteriaceae bacterium]|nr:S8 family serine peptidase [Propionibacteriaceae bacterium]
MIRVLDPATAVVLPSKPEDGSGNLRVPLLGPTLYVSDQLVIRRDQAADRLDDRVQAALGSLGWALRPVQRRRRRQEGRRRYKVAVELESARPVTMQLVPAGSGPTSPPDAWVALQHIRAAAGDLAGAFALNHLVRACGSGGYWGGIGSGGYWGGIGSGGYWGGIGSGGYWGGIGSGGYWGGISGPAEYAAPGYGGKVPVAVVMANPALSAPALKRPPVVVMPDTGIGPHTWFPRDEGIVPAPPGAVSVVASATLGIPDDHPALGSDLIGDPLPLAGHGTFIAGIIRQSCPAARLRAHAVMDSAGELLEDDLLELLHDLLEQQLEALETGDPGGIVDVVSLSAGFYHEDLADEGADPQTLSGTEVATVLRDLGRAGVLVVAGAGNDATRRPFLPAAFAGETTSSDGLPLVSVGALNPNRSTVALFSNAGDWVTTYRHGAAIVSTLPERENAGAQSSTAAAPGSPDDHQRMTIDRDDFSGGFGVWSGTSFATPVLAGEILQALVEAGTEDVRLEALVERGRSVLARLLRPERP